MRTVGDGAMAANFTAVKSIVQCPDIAADEVILKSSGKDLRGKCPLPGHEGDSPSFYCYDNGSGFFDKWWCFRCGQGGDVVDLFAAMHGLTHNLGFALDAIAERYRIKLWKDTDLMSTNQLMTMKARKQSERRLADALTSIAFSRWVMPVIRSIEDEGERALELKRCLKVAGLG